MRFSFTNIISGLFLAFILHSIYNIVLIFRPPTCDNTDKTCYVSYLNTKPALELLVYTRDYASNYELILHEKKFNYNKPFERELSLHIPAKTRKNGTLHIRSVVIPARNVKNEIAYNIAAQIVDATVLEGQLTQYTVPQSSTFNLLKDEAQKQSIRPVSHLKTKYSVIMCTDELSMTENTAPMELVNFIRINQKLQILPMITHDFLQTRLRDLQEIKGDITHMNFTYSYNPYSVGKLKFLVQMETTFKQFRLFGFNDKDIDEVKGVFADTNLYLLCATVFIGSIHLLLDFLSFKNDISFWKSHRSMAGLSSRTVLWRAFSQTVIFLYLLDEGTSLLVLVPSGIGTFIEFWKVKKMFKATISFRNGISFDKARKESTEEIKTREYDEESMKYLGYVLYPLCILGAVYSLIYQPHKSWYSWTINSLVNGVYVFGFLFMLPQLFVNYRLKSVAALPWRAFTYRAFNTFIDDIFAFIITMPTAHRLACFRDDVVFIVYLYQRWLYPVDKNRVDDIGSEDVAPTISEKEGVKISQKTKKTN